MCQTRQRAQGILCVFPSPITKSGAILAGKIVLFLWNSSMIHIQIVFFDKLRDDRDFTIGEISPLLQDRASIRFYEELRRICFRQLLVTCVYMHGFNDTFGGEVEIMIRNSVPIILRHATPPKTADSFCTGSERSAVQWHPYLFLSALRLC